MRTLNGIDKITPYKMDNGSVLPGDDPDSIYIVEKGPVLLWKYLNSQGAISPIDSAQASSSGVSMQDCSKFKYLVINFLDSTANSNTSIEQIAYLNPYFEGHTFSGGTSLYLWYISETGYVYTRNISIASKTTFTLSNGSYYTASSSTPHTLNTCCILLEIWGTNVI